jgi:uncharacterized protein (DUF1697 family)
MKTYVALLRGINVGGRNSLRMSELKEILSNLGCRDVMTYIQSGNVVFRSAEDPKWIAQEAASEVHRRHGFEPRVLLLEKSQFMEAIERNPFTPPPLDSKALHLGFLGSTPSAPNLAELEALKTPTEQFSLVGRVFYLLAPDGIGRSKLAAKSEKLIGCTMTDRNWRTVTKIQSMLETLGK